MKRTILTMIVRCFFFTIAMLALCSHAVAAEAGPAKRLDFTKGDKPDPTKGFSLHIGQMGGMPNGSETYANEIYVGTVTKGQENGILQVGDVILGVNGTLFTGDVIKTWRAAVAAAPYHNKRGTLRVIRWRNGSTETVDIFTVTPLSDLTIGTNRYTVDRTITYNLGPTGLRGWIFLEPTRGFWTGETGTMTDGQPWQILVTTVGTGTPAYGILYADDVILGVKAGGGTVAAFTNDSRKALGAEIGAAEASNGVLRVLINRYGVATNQTYTLQLRLSNLAYSATAPYNCAKSTRILNDIQTVISNKNFIDEMGHNFSLGMAWMAMGITNAKLQAFARGLPTNGNWAGNYWSTWLHGYQALFLVEYYSLTGDTNVLPWLTTLVSILEHGQSLFGTYSAIPCQYGPYDTNGLHGSASGYGPINAVSLPINLALLLAQKKCGITNAAVAAAVDRATKFYRFYVDKGSIPYGEHEPGEGFSSNGKNEMCAMFFSRMEDRPMETEYFTRKAVSSYRGREFGHTGQGFQYLWDAAAVSIGGTNALVEYLKRLRWHIDLARRCDGSFTYDGREQYGGSENITNYWMDASYATLEMSAVYALTFSLPSRRLYFTGKDANPTHVLSDAALSNALWAGEFILNRSTLTTNQLLSCFGEWDPSVRMYAARELATRPGSNMLVAGLITMTTNADRHVREVACVALGMINNTSALTALSQRLSDTHPWVRAMAADALALFGSAAAPQCAAMMVAFTNNAVVFDPWNIHAEDPLQIVNGMIAEPIFSKNPDAAVSQPTNLLYAALRVGLAQPCGWWRSTLNTFLTDRLTWEHVQTIAPELVAAAKKSTPGDRMFGAGTRTFQINALGKYRVEEAIPLALQWDEEGGMGSEFVETTTFIINNYYRGSVPEVIPTLIAWSNRIASTSFYESYYKTIAVAKINSAISQIVNDPAPPAMNYFKKFTTLSATPSAITLPSTSAVKTHVVDADGGTPHYTWSKVSGPGSVTFTPNDSTASSNATATFSAPGTYVVRARVHDSFINDSTLWPTSVFSQGWFPSPIPDCKTYTNGFLAISTNLTITVYGQRHAPK